MSTILDVVARVIDERARQDAQWGEQNHGDLYWLAILQEEVGEAAHALVLAPTNRQSLELDDELTQVAAVCVAWLECRLRRARAMAATSPAPGEPSFTRKA